MDHPGEAGGERAGARVGERIVVDRTGDGPDAIRLRIVHDGEDRAAVRALVTLPVPRRAHLARPRVRLGERAGTSGGVDNGGALLLVAHQLE